MIFGEGQNAPEQKAVPAASCACCAPRRGFLGKAAALGAAAALPSLALAQGAKKAAPRAKPFRIDVHHHLVYPGYLSEIGDVRSGSGFKWTPEMSIEDMDKSGIAIALLSIVQPSASVADAEKARHIARTSNEYGAQLVRDHPGRFGSFATLPMTDTDASLKEIEYALDTLKANGIGLMTSYGDKYLGDAAFAPVWEELDRRKAVVYTHPLTPQCCRNTVPGVPPGVIEYATDTTRTIASLVFSGSAARYPNIRWIFSHGGGTMPFLLSRFMREESTMKERERRLPRGVQYELKKFYYDTAQANHPGALAAMMRLIPITQVVYGSDFPFRPGVEVNEGLTQFRFKPRDQRAIERDNALRLLPALKT
ncbi:MAG TPA: amidohydrolase family protein [Burkholderiales bacterium]|nr:amidohydrolase family protein [Burkholderiales bacterium]